MNFYGSALLISSVVFLLVGSTTAQLGDNPDLRPICQSDEECDAGPCDFDGPNPNDNEEWFYCTEPESCDPSAPRRVDGVCNNLAEGRRLEGSTGHLQLRRIEGTTETQFDPRFVSNTIVGFPGEIPNNFGGNILQVFTGQFIDHDLALTLPQEEGAFEIEADGGLEPIYFELSLGVRTEGNPPALPNENTCWIDLGTVYGGTLRDEELLRAFEDGLLNSVFVGDGEFLPLNSRIDEEVELENQILPGNFAAGDIRVNENPVLTSIHTLFMREHNRLAREFAEEDPSLDDEELYQLARKWNIAQWQNIVFNEWFFAWHREPLPEYRGYRPEIRPEIDLVFSTATFRFGHTVLPNFIRRISADGSNDQTFLLGESFFRTAMVEIDGGADTWLKGATRHCHQRVDNFIVESVRNRLFDDIPGANTLAEDLMVRNIQRGRDHEIGRYVDIREFLNLTVPTTFDQVTGNQECITRRYEEVYGVDNVDVCDPIVCAFGEPATRGEVGETLFNNQREQFTRIRDGDRFYFENQNEDGPGFTQEEIDQILNTGIADILRRNTLLNDQVGDENYVLDNGFQTEECCRTEGNDDADTICILQNGRYVPTVIEDHCEALDTVEAGGAVFAGAAGFDCACNQTPLPCQEQGEVEFLEVVQSSSVASVEACQALCLGNDDCGAWTFDADEGTCTIGSSDAPGENPFTAVSGDVTSCAFRECRDCVEERFVMVMDGCPGDGNAQEERCASTTDASVTFNARCCSSFFVDTCESICVRGTTGAAEQSYAAAERECFERGAHICTVEELNNDQCCNEECAFEDLDDSLIWTRDPCNPQDFVNEEESGAEIPGGEDSQAAPSVDSDGEDQTGPDVDSEVDGDNESEGTSSGAEARALPSLAIAGTLVAARVALN